ncbi:MAG: TetR/AcrR family transcriptional regulator [Hyphomonadaceae bacterium]
MDARARHTRLALARALIRLAPERGFDALSVEELARAARVGRSTFYGHYAGKSDLLDRGLADMLRAMNRDAWAKGERALLPVRPLFTHIAAVPDFAAELVRTGAFDAMLARAEEVLRAIAEENLARPEMFVGPERRRQSAVMLSGAFTALLRWWLHGGRRSTPEAMQQWFDRFAGAMVAGGASPGPARHDA